MQNDKRTACATPALADEQTNKRQVMEAHLIGGIRGGGAVRGKRSGAVPARRSEDYGRWDQSPPTPAPAAPIKPLSSPSRRLSKVGLS